MKSPRIMLPPRSNHRNHTMENNAAPTVGQRQDHQRHNGPPVSSEVKAHFRHITIGQRQLLEQLSFAGTEPSERHVRQRGAKEVAAVTFLNVLKQLEAQRATQSQQKLQAKSSCCCTAIACS
jgi:hypothetical protein